MSILFKDVSLKVNISSVGEDSTVSLRPERVAINASEGEFENKFEAQVKELIYLGDHIRCRMNVAGDDQFIVKVPNTSGQLGLEIGANLFVGWNTEDCRALDFRQQV